MDTAEIKRRLDEGLKIAHEDTAELFGVLEKGGGLKAIEDANKRIANLEAQLKDAQGGSTARIGELETQLASLSSDNESLVKQVATVTAERDAAIRERDDLKAVAEGAANSIAGLNAKIDELQALVGISAAAAPASTAAAAAEPAAPGSEAPASTAPQPTVVEPVAAETPTEPIPADDEPATEAVPAAEQPTP